MILISYNGEQQLIADDLLATVEQMCPGCTIVAQGVTPNPDPAAAWDGTAFTVPLATLKARKSGEVDLYLYNQFQGGFSPTTGPLLGKTLQTRDSTDRTNWLTSTANYKDQIDQSNGAVVGATFRCSDNSTVTCSYSDGYAALIAMSDWGKALMLKSWKCKDQIAALADAASVTAYDVPTQWAAA